MDWNSNHLVPESVEDNASSVHVDYSKIVNHGSSTTVFSHKNVSANGLAFDDNHEKDVRSPEQLNVELAGAKSPAGSLPSTRKGFGLKKWRRIKREGLMKDGTVNVDSSKVLKRGLPGSVNPPSTPVTISSVEAKQSSEGSVGSVNMVNYPCMANGFSPDPDSKFVIGQPFPASVELENSKDDNSQSSSVASARNITSVMNLEGNIIQGSASRQIQQGKSFDDMIKKARGDRAIPEAGNPYSSLAYDLRSANFVLLNGAFSVADNGQQSERWKNHDGEYSSEGYKSELKFSREVQNGYSREDDEHKTQDGTRNHRKDPLMDSILSLAAVQEALGKEVQDLREIGRGSISLHHDVDEPTSSNLLRTENLKGNNTKSMESLELIFKHNISHLESKLEEAKAILDSKDAKIWELENLKIEYELEGLFQRRIEAEVEHLMLASSLKTSGVLYEQKETQIPKKAETKTTEDWKHNGGDISGKACKFGLCFLMQFILLVFVLRFFILRLSPDSQAVIPT